MPPCCLSSSLGRGGGSTWRRAPGQRRPLPLLAPQLVQPLPLLLPAGVARQWSRTTQSSWAATATAA
jgi:hypothetical protein